MNTRNDIDNQKREAELREAYAARRRPPLDSLTGADLSGIDRRTPEPDLADLIAEHSIHIASYDAIVYARIGEREVGVKYSATSGDKAKAVRLAVREVLRLVGVPV